MRGIGHVAYFWILEPLLSMAKLMLQTSNFSGGFRVRDTKQKIWKWIKKGRSLGHVTYFWILEPLLSLDRPKLQTLNFAGGLKVDIKQKIKKWAKKERSLTHIWILEHP